MIIRNTLTGVLTIKTITMTRFFYTLKEEGERQYLSFERDDKQYKKPERTKTWKLLMSWLDGNLVYTIGYKQNQ